MSDTTDQAAETDAITPVAMTSSVPGEKTAVVAGSSERNSQNLSPTTEKIGTIVSSQADSSAVDSMRPDPLEFGRHRRDNVTRRQMKIDHPNGSDKKLKKYYTRQNDLIDQFLGAGEEERMHGEEIERMGPKIKFAVNASFVVNFCLFIIQLYAAVSTGSLAVIHQRLPVRVFRTRLTSEIAVRHRRRRLC
jgi:hypothetical protein